MQTLTEQAAALDSGQTTARALVENGLARIADPDGEGGRAFLTVYRAAAPAVAEALDVLRRARRAPGPFAGIPVSLKDLLDVAGEVTTAGSRALADAPAAASHAPVVQRLLAAGFVPVGRTNMTEFAYSGLGLNPHHGTPRAPWDRAAGGRIPGGSSSGAAVSVADGMATVAIGTDTGGSCRIPAACCGIVGFKPTARRVPTEGVLPLSPTLDSVGPLARSVADCALVDAVLAGEAPRPPAAADPGRITLAVPDMLFLDDLEAPVAETFELAVRRLAGAGMRIVQAHFPALAVLREVNAGGGISPPEAFAWHRDLLARRGADYDPRVRVRIARGGDASAADFAALLAARSRIRRAMDAATAPYDALLSPTIPILPPRIADLADDAAYLRANAMVLRNTSVANFLDRCAISLPCHAPGAPPVGLMLTGETMGDARLFAVAAAVERALAG